MAQQVIRTEYGSTVVLSNIRKGKSSIPVIGMNDSYTATKVTTWHDGSVMTPEKADGAVYLRYKETDEYFKVNLPNDGELFLEKDTVAQLRNMSAVEILLLKMGYYKGVTLSGYYSEGDTPAPIQYYLSDTTESDDGGSVFEVGSIKLEHVFGVEINIKYFGWKLGEDFSDRYNYIINNYDIINHDGADVVAHNIVAIKDHTRIINGRFTFNGGVLDNLIRVTGNDINLTGVVIDGDERQPSFSLIHIHDNCKNFTFKDSVIENLRCTVTGLNSQNNTYGVTISPYGVKNFLIENVTFKNFVKYNDSIVKGSPTVGHGFVGGIFFYNGVEPSTPSNNYCSGLITNCYFENITNVLDDGLDFNTYSELLDADAVRFYSVSGGINYFDVTISNCTFSNISKRAIKLSGSNFCKGVKMYNNTVYADGMQYPMVTAVKLDSDTVVDGFKFYATVPSDRATILFQFQGSRNCHVKNIYGNHVDGVVAIVPQTTNTIEDLSFTDFIIDNWYSYGVVQGGTVVESQRNIFFKNFTANPAQGRIDQFSIRLGNSTDLTCGVYFENCEINGGNAFIYGKNIKTKGLRIKIDNPDYIGNIVGGGNIVNIGAPSSVGRTFVDIQDLDISIEAVSPSFLTLSRKFYLIRGNGNFISNLSLKVSDSVTTNIWHGEINGEDVKVNGITYDGTASLRFGQTEPIKNSIVSNVKRSTKSTLEGKSLIYCNHAENDNVVFDTITETLVYGNSCVFLNQGLKYTINGLYHGLTVPPITDVSLSIPSVKSNVIKFGTDLRATTAVRGLVNQSTASADTATQAAGETPTKAEFDALLAELRDLKTKMRAGDAPILSS